MSFDTTYYTKQLMEVRAYSEVAHRLAYVINACLYRMSHIDHF